MNEREKSESLNGHRVTRFLLLAALLAFGLLLAAKAEAAVQNAPRAMAEIRSADALRSVVRTNDGVARLEFTARAGVWGNGQTWNITRDDEPGRRHYCEGCTNGPIRVTVRVEDGEEIEVRSQVGGAWKEPGRDIGRSDAAAAADYLLGLAEHGGRDLDSDSREEALQAAVSADGGVDWERLLNLARDRSRGTDVREAALFWTAHEAGARAAAGIEEIATASDEETDVQEAAVFALTQLPEERGTDALLRLARENRNPEIVQSVYFWLGQRDDPRILAFFEEVLLD